MILDDYLKLADGQSSTASAASTNVIDTLASGDTYQGAFFYFRTDADWTESGTNTVTIELQTADTEDFTGASPVTLAQTGAINVSSMTGNYEVKIPVPLGAKRYIRGYKTVSPNSGANYVTAATYDMFIAKDVDNLITDKDA